ncbi:MAG: Sec-independent protein translocase protein TatB [Gammaproteobacteria bacterium]|nr:Sec-independent protein translocase protein TatB [Gammaproteobacteria bacterium]
MFDIGFWELLLIAIVALVVVGPERLPKLIRVVGLWVGKANASVQSIRSEISRELRAEELKQALNKTVLESEQSINALKTSVDLTEVDSAKTADKTIKDNNGNG